MPPGPPRVPFCHFVGDGSPAKIDHRRKGTLIPIALLEDLGHIGSTKCGIGSEDVFVLFVPQMGLWVSSDTDP